MDDSRWHILRVKPGTETAVAQMSGVPAYVPHRRVVSFNRKMRKVVSSLRAMLPGVVFLKLRAPSDLKLFAPSKVVGFLRNGDMSPAVLTEKAFRALVEVEKEVMAVPERKEAPKEIAVKVGDTVGVRMALFSDAVRALVEEVKGNSVLLRVLKSNLRVETTTGKLVA
jgi:transcription antitermination factor NusG